MTVQPGQVAPKLVQVPSDGEKRVLKGLAVGRHDPLDRSRDFVPPSAAVPGKADPTLEAPAGTWGY